MAKIQLQSAIRKNSTVVLLHSGVTEFDHQGKTEVDVTDEQLQDMLDTYDDLSDGSQEIKHQVDVNTLGKSADDENNIGGTEDSDPLAPLDFAGLKEVATQGGFPEKEWNKLDEAGLRAYLTKQLQAQ